MCEHACRGARTSHEWHSPACLVGPPKYGCQCAQSVAPHCRSRLCFAMLQYDASHSAPRQYDFPLVPRASDSLLCLVPQCQTKTACSCVGADSSCDRRARGRGRTGSSLAMITTGRSASALPVLCTPSISCKGASSKKQNTQPQTQSGDIRPFSKHDRGQASPHAGQAHP